MGSPCLAERNGCPRRNRTLVLTAFDHDTRTMGAGRDDNYVGEAVDLSCQSPLGLYLSTSYFVTVGHDPIHPLYPEFDEY